MSTARLRSLRLVGFKSFAERTLVEFGPGISAIVGPNGSGKSNLADALRWVLGEQGRTLRTRRAEDLIYAGSSSRRAQGMSDVTLLLDNEDGLLPVEYAEVELGRRLFRNGENEFLLNRQRVRLRDLVDLLDEANLADNAFLFIGQGMVDQALALRPEERRPLFGRRPASASTSGGGGPRSPSWPKPRRTWTGARPGGRAASPGTTAGSTGGTAAGAALRGFRAGGGPRGGRALSVGGAARELADGSMTLERARVDADAALERLRLAELPRRMPRWRSPRGRRASARSGRAWRRHAHR